MTSHSGAAYWSAQKTGRLRPQKTVGMVVFNTAISVDMVTDAVTNPKPLYKLASGVYREYVDDVRAGDVIYKYNNIENIDEHGAGTPFGHNNDTTTIRAMCILNGQGSELESEASFESKCTILGLAEYDKASGKERFTTGSGGIMTTTNNGTKIISTGDRIIARAPTKQQLREAVKGAEGKAGLVKFQLHPYSPKLHRTQPKEIFQCLSDGNSVDYLPAYKRQCRQIVDSHLGTAMIVIMTEWENITKIMTDRVPLEKKALALLTVFGHSDVNGKRNALLEERFFVPYSKTKGNKTPYLCKVDNANDTEVRVNRIQEQSMGQAIESTAFFVHQLDDLIVGDAKSSANPGEDFSIQLRSYSR